MADVRLIGGPFDGIEQEYGFSEDPGYFPKELWFDACDIPGCSCEGSGVMVI